MGNKDTCSAAHQTYVPEDIGTGIDLMRLPQMFTPPLLFLNSRSQLVQFLKVGGILLMNSMNHVEYRYNQLSLE